MFRSTNKRRGMLWSAGGTEAPLVIWSKDNLEMKKQVRNQFYMKGQFTHHKGH